MPLTDQMICRTKEERIQALEERIHLLETALERTSTDKDLLLWRFFQDGANTHTDSEPRNLDQSR